MDTMTSVVFLAVVAGRFFLPLFIFKYPLPAIIGCLVLDGYDQTIFQAFGADPPGYQSYDKAMDIWYLAVAYLSTLRNWRSDIAFKVAWFLYFYRLVGVLLFEFTHLRPLLLIFPNAFEYFFIAYEVIRSRWNVLRFGWRVWVGLAAIIWVVVKLPQEYWLHIAQMDMSETLDDHPWVWAVLAALVALALLLIGLGMKNVLGPPDHALQIAAPRIPAHIDTAAARAAWISRFDAVRSVATVEKVVLVGLVAVIYGSVLPDYSGSKKWLFLGVAAVVVLNAVYSIAIAHRRWTISGAARSIAVRLVFNLLLVDLADWFINNRSGDLHTTDTFFFMTLVAIMTTLHDRYRPVHATLMREVRTTAVSAGETSVRPAESSR